MKGRKHKMSGGEAGEKDFGKPEKDWDEDLESKPEMRNNAKKIKAEAEEKKHGGRAKRKHGGKVKHHEHGEHMKHAKHVGAVKGKREVHAGRAPRKSGGRAGSNFSPLSSAHSGTPPRGHKTLDVD